MYLIYGPVNSSDECRFLGYFGFKYYKSRPTKDPGNDPATRNKFNIQQEKNYIVNCEVEEIILQ